MNEKEQAVLDAARDVLQDFAEPFPRSLWRLAVAVEAACNPHLSPAQVVQSVDDLRDGDELPVVFVYDSQSGYFKHGGFLMVEKHSQTARDAVAVGAITRPPAPKPDPAEIQWLSDLLSEVDDKTLPDPLSVDRTPLPGPDFPALARALLCAGVRLPEERS